MYAMVYSTVPSEAEGKRIGRDIIEKRLAACVNMLPIESIYHWQGKIEESEEWALIFKTKSGLAPRIIKEIEKQGTYEVMCAVSYEMSGGADKYLQWIDENTV